MSVEDGSQGELGPRDASCGSGGRRCGQKKGCGVEEGPEGSFLGRSVQRVLGKEWSMRAGDGTLRESRSPLRWERIVGFSFRKDGGVFEGWVEAESQAASGGGLSESLRGPARKCKETRKKEGARDSVCGRVVAARSPRRIIKDTVRLFHFNV